VQRFLDAAFMKPTSLADDAVMAAECAKWVRGNDRLTPAEQVDIYRRQFWLRHDEALLDDFPGLRRIIGESAWDALLRDYLAAHPPHTPSLRDLGQEMSRFVESYAFEPSIAELARDMVRYELAFIDVFDGADPPALDTARIAALTPEAWQSARIVLSGLVRRLRFDHPVHLLRKAIRERNALVANGAAEVPDEPPLPEPKPTRLALFRRANVVHFEELEPAAIDLLDALGRGLSLVEACGEVAGALPQAEAEALGPKVGGWFQRWASWGFIADVVVP
jgi:hypothetical protein